MIVVAALYHFTRFADLAALRDGVEAVCRPAGVVGTVLLAHEGLNGTIAGSRAGIDAALAHLRGLPGCADLEWKESHTDKVPFARLKVRLKREIVSMGVPDTDPVARVGHYVQPADWNALIAAPDVVVIDTRNEYEVAIGSFAGAVDPGTGSFREFPGWWRANSDRFAGKRIAMFCTGGIRCEKSTNYLLSQGVEAVYHLKGGILKYLEDVPEADSQWQGQCFVFDRRVSVGQGLVPGDLDSCDACRRPLTAAQKAHPAYEAGACCPHCAEEHTDADRARFRERHRQIALAAARGQRHLGR